MLKRVRNPLILSCLLSAFFISNSVWIHAKAVLAQILIEHAWAETLVTGHATPPWPWADFWPVARLIIKRTGNKLYVLSSASGESLSFGPGHMNGSAMPAESGTSIIAGHRDTHFYFLKKSRIGDVLNLQRADGYSIDFKVTGMEVVDIRQARLTIEPGKTQLKLVTCYPFDAVLPGGPKRLVVELLKAGARLQG